MDKLQTLNNEIKNLLNKGYSASKIAKTLHKRKQTILDAVRNIKHVKKNTKKITNIKGKIGSNNLNFSTQRFAETLYKQGYPMYYIVDLVHEKHKENSKNKIRNYLKTLNNDKNLKDIHKTNMKFYKSSGKWKQHLDAKYYRETEKHYYDNFNEQFKEGSPIIEYEDELYEETLQNGD